MTSPRRQLIEIALRPRGSRHTLAEIAAHTTLDALSVRIELVRMVERSRWDGGALAGTDGATYWLLGAAKEE